jgi:hypothetical protein
MSELTFAGLIPSNETYFNYDNAPYGYCGNPNITEGTSNSDVPSGTTDCTANFLNYYTLESDFNSICATKENCTFRVTDYINFNGQNGTSVCVTNPAKVYMQYKCK